jgi:hypothetical protein
LLIFDPKPKTRGCSILQKKQKKIKFKLELEDSFLNKITANVGFKQTSAYIGPLAGGPNYLHLGLHL